MARAVSDDGRGQNDSMASDPASTQWPCWWRRVLLVLAVMASTATAVIFGFLAFMFISGYSGGSSPTSIAPIAFPIALFFFVVVGVPAVVISVLLWFAYRAARSSKVAGARQPPAKTAAGARARRY